MSARIANPAFAAKVMSAADAAALIHPGASIGFSGFTGSGYPKEIPSALAARITDRFKLVPIKPERNIPIEI